MYVYFVEETKGLFKVEKKLILRMVHMNRHG